MIVASDSRSGRRATLQVASVTYVGLLLSLVSTPVLVGALGAVGRGQLGKSLILMQLFGMFLFLGVPRGLSVARSQGLGLYRPAVFATLGLGVVGAAAVLLLAPLMADNRSVLRLVQASAVGLLFAGPGAIGGDIALARGKFALYNLWRGAPLIIPSLGVIVAGMMHVLTLQIAFFLNLTSVLVSSAIGCTILVFSWMSSPKHSHFDWSFSLRFWASTSSDAIGYRADQLLGAAFLSGQSLGVYLVSFTIASAGAGLTQSMNQVAYSRLLKEVLDESGFVRLRRSISLTSGLLVTLTTWVLAVPLFGSEFADAWIIVGLLATAQVLRDSWAWIVLRSSAASSMSGVQLVSFASLCSLFVGLLVLGFHSLLAPWVLGACMIAYGLLRLLMFWALRGKFGHSSAVKVGGHE